MHHSSLKLYLPTILFVLLWWGCAFLPLTRVNPVNQTVEPSAERSLVQAAPYLAPLSRQKIHEALLGNIDLMLSLMAEWDTEAQLLALVDQNVQRLPASKYLRGQLIGRQMQARGKGSALETPPELTTVVDDAGSALSLTTDRTRFLPQTYVAASFLIALSPPEQIVALPKGFREQTQVIPAAYANRVLMDIGPYQTELLAQYKPQLAFVAPYTLPATRQALLGLGAELFVIDRVDTIETIQSSLKRVGQAVGRAEEAELLALFMEAALCALDNRLNNACPYRSNERPDTLYLNYYAKFSAPTCRTLTGHLLGRLGLNTFPALAKASEDSWQISLEVEKIVEINPKAIILSSTHEASLKTMVLQHPALQQVSAVRNGRVYTVDEIVQDSPSQFAVLAYYDLVKVLIDAGRVP